LKDIDGDVCEVMTLASAEDNELSNNYELPSEYGISGIYPNPFNPSTTIEWSIINAGTHRVDIYNTSGQLIETISQGYVNPGSHQITWNPNGISSGIYIVRLTTDNNIIDSRKVMLLK